MSLTYLNCESTMTSPLPLSPLQISPAWEEAQICTFPSSSIWAAGQEGARIWSNVLKHSFGERNLDGRLLLQIKSMWATLPETLHLLQNTGTRVKVDHSLGVATDSVGVGDLSSSPASHYSGPCREAQTEILSLSQTDRSEIFPRLLLIDQVVTVITIDNNNNVHLMWENVLSVKSTGVVSVRRPTSNFITPRDRLKKNFGWTSSSVLSALVWNTSVSVSSSRSWSPGKYFKIFFQKY